MPSGPSKRKTMKTTSYCCLLALAGGLPLAALRAAESYPIVDTGQTKCYDNHGEIAPPKPGQPFHGQDAQFPRHPASYTLSADGLTVQDQVTGLTWQRSPDTDGDGALTRRDKLTLAGAGALPARLNAARFGGFDDWRLPTIKELFSLFDGRGTDPSGPMNMDPARLTPFIDLKHFKFAYGDTRAGERIIDSQYASSTKYAGPGARGFDKLFGVNFADGRIKGYDLFMPGGGMEKTFFVLCVRGNPGYGKNDFQDHHDGTITDRATGLMWSQTDSGRGLNWQEALAWVQQQNAKKHLGHADWRLPSVKELQSIVDYSRCPDATQSPALDPMFTCSVITNEVKQVDYPFYWSATTHAGLRGAEAAMYVAFGRAAGWMSPRGMAGGPRGGFGPQGMRGPGRGGPPPLGAGGPAGGGPGRGAPPPLGAGGPAGGGPGRGGPPPFGPGGPPAGGPPPFGPDGPPPMGPGEPPGPDGPPPGPDAPGITPLAAPLRTPAGSPPPPRQGAPGNIGNPGAQAADYRYVDVHGAGSQRSDPKAGNPAAFPFGRGPQGDVIRINNYIRLVRWATP
jgi:hypothetical protein